MHSNFIGWFSDDLINFCEKIIKNKIPDGVHFEKMAAWKTSGRDVLWAV